MWKHLPVVVAVAGMLCACTPAAGVGPTPAPVQSAQRAPSAGSATPGAAVGSAETVGPPASPDVAQTLTSQADVGRADAAPQPVQSARPQPAPADTVAAAAPSGQDTAAGPPETPTEAELPTPPAAVPPQSPVAVAFPARQMIVVDADGVDSTTATLTVWESGASGTPKLRYGPVAAMVGADGVGEGRDDEARTPLGTFTLGTAFGLAPNPGTALPYFVLDRYDWWDGGEHSPTYNLHVRGPSAPEGSEHLADFAGAYDYAVDMGVNPDRVPGAGSAFFLHVSDGTPTAGCVAMPRQAMVDLLRLLDPGKTPTITIGIFGP